MSGIEFRRAIKKDAGEVLHVMAQAFGRGLGSEKYERDKERLARDIDAHWVLIQEGVIVGAVHVRREEIQVGRAIVAKADVGEVCIAPDCQGEGLGTVLMQMVVEQLRADGYSLSRLGGYRRFYERFGWVPFPRGYIDFPLQGLTSRGGFTDPVSYLNRPEEDARIRAYDGCRDAVACKALYAAFNAGRTGAVPKRLFGAGAENPWKVVYEVDGAVRAYVFASLNASPQTQFSAAVSISDGACDLGDIRPLGATLRYVLREAAIAGAESVRARLPLDPLLYDLYRDSSCGFVPSLWQSSEGGNMFQVLSLRGLFEAIANELAERLQTAEQVPGKIVLRVREETIGLDWDGDRVTVGEGNGDGVMLGQDGVMKMVLGLVPVEQVVEGTRADVALLRAAFPVQGTATGVWG
ncbi:MAG: GNAT family N-acetyltransferase [bacterium]|nr:GNAT family N-acetyltransferase [bacterium]